MHVSINERAPSCPLTKITITQYSSECVLWHPHMQKQAGGCMASFKQICSGARPARTMLIIYFSMKHDFLFLVKFHTFGLHVLFPPERMAVMSPIPNRKRHVIMSIRSGWKMIGCWGNAAYHVLLLENQQYTQTLAAGPI